LELEKWVNFVKVLSSTGTSWSLSLM